MLGLGEHLQMLRTITREVVNTRGRLVPSTNKEVNGPADDKAGLLTSTNSGKKSIPEMQPEESKLIAPKNLLPQQKALGRGEMFLHQSFFRYRFTLLLQAV